MAEDPFIRGEDLGARLDGFVAQALSPLEELHGSGKSGCLLVLAREVDDALVVKEGEPREAIKSVPRHIRRCFADLDCARLKDLVHQEWVAYINHPGARSYAFVVYSSATVSRKKNAVIVGVRLVPGLSQPRDRMPEFAKIIV